MTAMLILLISAGVSAVVYYSLDATNYKKYKFWIAAYTRVCKDYNKSEENCRKLRDERDEAINSSRLWYELELSKIKQDTLCYCVDCKDRHQ